MDILNALASTETPKTGRRCKIGRWLDEIPDETPGKAELVATLQERDRMSPDWRPLDQLDALLIRLNVQTSNKTIGDHRAGRCRCD